jgi:fructose-bisphosphate aldolase class I
MEVDMRFQGLEAVAKALVSDGKGILAADETVGTITKRFEMLKMTSTPESRRDYRELHWPLSKGFGNGLLCRSGDGRDGW